MTCSFAVKIGTIRDLHFQSLMFSFLRYTQRVEIGVVSYNPNYGLISLVTVNFFLNRSWAESLGLDSLTL